MKRLPLFLLLILPAPASAQLLGLPLFGDTLRLAQYLGLNSSQEVSIRRINNELDQFLAEKNRRVSQVEQEIYNERVRDTPDAFAIGTRYVELETICRESRDRRQQAMRDLRATLDPTQLQRLTALEQAWALRPVIAGADALTLMEAPGVIRVGNQTRALPGCQRELALLPATILRAPAPGQ